MPNWHEPGSDVKLQFDRALADWLAAEREAHGLSQEALATQLGRDQTYVSKFESGQRRVTVADLIEWVVALGIPWHTAFAKVRQLWTELSPGSPVWEGPAEAEWDPPE
jgi:transcriptional regulator with XRE-family HTH domain